MAAVSKKLGAALFPAQRYVLDVALEVMPDGSWAYEDVWITEPRRAGKTFLMRPLVTHRCLMKGGRSAWITAQKRDKAVARWRDIATPLKLSPMGPELRKLISNGHEELEFLKTGGLFLPFAPKEDELHGEDPDLVLVDEWWTFDLGDRDVIEAGYKPVWSVKSGQAWLMSTVGNQDSEWMNSGMEIGRAAVDSDSREGVAYFEWSIPAEGVGGVSLEDMPIAELVQLVADNHPRRDHGLRRPFLTSEANTSRSRFIRAYGNVPQLDAAEREWVIPKDVVTDLRARRAIPMVGRVGLGVQVSQFGRESSIWAGYVWQDGQVQVEQIDRRAGTRWVPDRVAELVAKWDVGAVAVHHGGPARDIADHMAPTLGATLLRLQGPDYAAATSRFVSGMTETRRIRWQSPDLQVAMETATLTAKPAGQQWDEVGTTLPAATLAAWAVEHMVEPEAVVPEFRIL